jgi:predicted regulator of Ras-like GTPase activity (Roadblock/LC7/MglB family)
MPTLPSLEVTDIQQLDQILSDLVVAADVTVAAIIDKGGFLITLRGDSRQFDLTTIAALASGAYLANQTIANLVGEENFDSVYQQGEKNSMFVLNVDEYSLLALIFRVGSSVGAVKYYSIHAGKRIALQLKAAKERNPENGLDLSELNLADTSELFHRKA